MKNNNWIYLNCIFLLALTSCKTTKKSFIIDNMKESQAIYQIDSTQFEFDITGIIGFVNEEGAFYWAMDLYAKRQKYQGIEVTPKFSFAELPMTEDFTYNQSFRWKEATAYDTENDRWQGSFYIYDSHYFTSQVEIQRVNDTSYHVGVSGKVNLNWETAPKEDYHPFKIIQTVPFNGILSEMEDDEQALKICSQYLNTSNMEWETKEGSDGFERRWLVYKD